MAITPVAPVINRPQRKPRAFMSIRFEEHTVVEADGKSALHCLRRKHGNYMKG